MIVVQCLRLSQSALGATSSGQIINLVSNDVARFELVCLMMMPMMSAPVTSAILIYFLYSVGGTASLWGIGSLVLILVIQGKLHKIIGHFVELFKSPYKKVI